MTLRDRRALLLGLGTIVAAVMLLRVAPAAIRAALAWRTRVAAQEQTLDRERELIAAIPQARDSLRQALAAVVALAPRIVAAATPAEASATLDSVVSLAASRHALKVQRIDPLPDSSAGVFIRVAVHVEVEGDVRGLAALLAALESGEPVLTVSALSVDAPQAAGSKEAPEILHIALSVSGFALRRGGW